MIFKEPFFLFTNQTHPDPKRFFTSLVNSSLNLSKLPHSFSIAFFKFPSFN
jgi:hypothetical protein